LRERYGDDPSTHSDFDPELWMEVGSFGGSDKNQVYGLCNTTAENLRTTRSVSTVGSSQSISNTQSKEFMALKQQYAQLSVDYQHLHQMIMDIRSKMGDEHVRLLFCHFVPRTTSLNHLLLLHHCSSLIFFWKHIKFVINIWMNIII